MILRAPRCLLGRKAEDADSGQEREHVRWNDFVDKEYGEYDPEELDSAGIGGCVVVKSFGGESLGSVHAFDNVKRVTLEHGDRGQVFPVNHLGGVYC